MVDLALKSLVHDKLRFAITISGVAFAVALVFVQVGLFLGLLDNASVTIEHIDADLWVTSKNTPNIDFAHLFPESYINRVRSIDGVARADNLIIQFMDMNLPTGATESVETYALEDFAAWGIPWNLEEGRLDDLRRGDNFVLDASAVKRCGPFRIGDLREILGRRMKVVGRSREALSFTTTPIAFIDYRVAQSMVDGLRGQTTYIVVKLAAGADVEAVRAGIRKRLPFNDVFTRDEWARHSRAYWVESTGLGLNMILTVFLGCLVGVVVVAQTLYTSTMEHLREFGTMKAIGGSNFYIYTILGEQALIAAIAGFFFGALMSYALRPAIAKIDLKLIIPPELAIVVFFGAIAMCLASAMISFRKVARIDPALVFRT